MCGNVVLTTNGLGGFGPVGLTQNADNLFNNTRFAFHHGPPFGLRKTHVKAGSTIGGYVSCGASAKDTRRVPPAGRLETENATLYSNEGCVDNEMVELRGIEPLTS